MVQHLRYGINQCTLYRKLNEGFLEPEWAHPVVDVHMYLLF